MIRAVGYAVSAGGRGKPRRYAGAAHQDLACRVDRNGQCGAHSRATEEIGEHEFAVSIEFGHKGSPSGLTRGRRPQIAAAGDRKIRRCGRARDIRIADAIDRNGVGVVANRSAQIAHVEILTGLRVQLHDQHSGLRRRRIDDGVSGHVDVSGRIHGDRFGSEAVAQIGGIRQYRERGRRENQPCRESERERTHEHMVAPADADVSRVSCDATMPGMHRAMPPRWRKATSGHRWIRGGRLAEISSSRSLPGQRQRSSSARTGSHRSPCT